MEVQVKARATLSLYRGYGLAGRFCFSLARSSLTVLLIVGCGAQDQRVQPREITKETVCTLDDMLLMDYPGPKGQIHYAQGPPDFFCDTMEVFALYLRPEQQKRAVAVFVQDMGKADWNQPRGHWIDARTGFYVFGSNRHGSMGPTLASFAREEDAQLFAKKHGGKVLRFNEVTLDMVALDGGVLRDERM
jgi:copper chaperone NosL